MIDPSNRPLTVSLGVQISYQHHSTSGTKMHDPMKTYGYLRESTARVQLAHDVLSGYLVSTAYAATDEVHRLSEKLEREKRRAARVRRHA